MTPGSPEDAVSPSAATNNRVAAALADVAKLIGAHAYLPAPSYITCSPNYNNNPPLVDLWLDRPEDVTAWARKLGADVNVRTTAPRRAAHSPPLPRPSSRNRRAPA